MDRETFPAMAADWRRTVDACGELDDVGNETAAYLGFSMGAVLGIPTVAEEPRFRCAVFAIGGIQAERPNLLSRAAAKIDRPVLLVNQSEDEMFSREAVFRLFDPLVGPKSVTFYPGPHGAVPREAMEQMRGFLRAHLCGSGGESDAPNAIS
jgi:dienelactone hydrolase